MNVDFNHHFKKKLLSSSENIWFKEFLTTCLLQTGI